MNAEQQDRIWRVVFIGLFIAALMASTAAYATKPQPPDFGDAITNRPNVMTCDFDVDKEISICWPLGEAPTEQSPPNEGK